MKLKYRGVSYDYTPPEVTYPSSSTSEAIKKQVRFLTLAERERTENRQQSMLMRSLHNIGLNSTAFNSSEHTALI